MTSYSDAATGYPQAGPAAAPVSRPGTLIALIGVAVVSALAAIVDGVMYLAGGRELALDVAAKAIASVTGESSDVIKSEGGVLLSAAVDEVQNTLQTRGAVTMVFGVLLLVTGLLSLGSAVWARVLVTLAGLLNAGIALRLATDIDGGSAAIRGVGWLAAATGLVVVVLAWLPANNRYAKARKGR